MEKPKRQHKNSVNPQMSNEEYCSGYQHGFADTNNNKVLGK